MLLANTTWSSLIFTELNLTKEEVIAYLKDYTKKISPLYIDSFESPEIILENNLNMKWIDMKSAKIGDTKGIIGYNMDTEQSICKILYLGINPRFSLTENIHQ